MRFKQYILNEGRSSFITEEKALSYIKKYCSDALNDYKNKKILYRGIPSKGDYLFIDPKKGKPRKSANTNNYYTLLIDNMPSWKKYPKRSQSIICSTSKQNAAGYGELFEVFPYNGSKIGVCPYSDIWFSFDKTMGSSSLLNYFNKSIEMLASQFNIKIDDNNFQSFKKSIDKLDIAIRENIDKVSSFNIVIKLWRKSSESLLDYFMRLLEPKENNFKIVNRIGDIKNYNKDITIGGKECWTDGKCILVQNVLWSAGAPNYKIMEL